VYGVSHGCRPDEMFGRIRKKDNMKKRMIGLSIVFVLFALSSIASAQEKYFTKSGALNFDCSTSVEDITAKNAKGVCVLDTKTGAIELAVLMKAFEFKRALMQEHFNENYVESDKYPKAIFKGKVENCPDLTKNGTYDVVITGTMDLHGVTKRMTATGKIVVNGSSVSATTEFIILLSDYAIEIPSVVKDKISNKVKISVSLWLAPLK
jgi:hypothetical protein